jgi:hypothetical protein
MINMIFSYSSMSPDKKYESKAPMTKASTSRSHQEEEVDNLGTIYDDTTRFIVRGTSLKWGEVLQMFKNQSFPQEIEDELKIFKNIQKSKLHKVATHGTIFPYVDTISWIVKHVYLDNKHILNAKGHPITSF